MSLTTIVVRFFLYLAVFLLLVQPLTFTMAQNGNAVVSRRDQLERELAALEIEIEKERLLLEDKKKQRVSLERDIAILNAEIKKAKLSIQARNIVIEKLNDEINSKQGTINTLGRKIDREKESLSDLIRKTNRIDEFTFAEFILTNKTISEFFADFDVYSLIKGELRESYHLIEGNKKETESAKLALEEKKIEEVNLRKIQELQKRRIEQQEKEKQHILKVTKGVESVYQKVILAGEKNAAAIRSELFALRGSAAIPFEQALDYANEAANKTGIRPAFLLAIIAEESNLGENVGTGNWKVDMKNPRDTEPFLDITKRLGLNPDNMPVSKKPWYGWGGAMGPAQFIPSTWIQYESKIAALTGSEIPNPWSPRDAFFASAILLADGGATAKTAKAERLAALRYLAGWANASKPAYAFYGDDVMVLAEKYQRQIDILGGR